MLRVHQHCDSLTCGARQQEQKRHAIVIMKRSTRMVMIDANISVKPAIDRELGAHVAQGDSTSNR